jgi:hypothetical protein
MWNYLLLDQTKYAYMHSYFGKMLISYTTQPGVTVLEFMSTYINWLQEDFILFWYLLFQCQTYHLWINLFHYLSMWIFIKSKLYREETDISPTQETMIKQQSKDIQNNLVYPVNIFLRTQSYMWGLFFRVLQKIC